MKNRKIGTRIFLKRVGKTKFVLMKKATTVKRSWESSNRRREKTNNNKLTEQNATGYCENR